MIPFLFDCYSSGYFVTMVTREDLISAAGDDEDELLLDIIKKHVCYNYVTELSAYILYVSYTFYCKNLFHIAACNVRSV